MSLVDQTVSTLSDSSLRREPASQRADVLVVLAQCDDLTAGSSRHLLDEVDEICIVRGDRRGHQRVLAAHARRLILQVRDQRISTTHALIRRRGVDWLLEDAGSKNGSLVNGVRVEQARLRDGDVIECGRTFFRFRVQQEWPSEVPADWSSTEARGELLGLSTFFEPLAKQLRALPSIACTNLSVLVLGPSGSGKELIARAVHALSARRGACVPVNCGALPENLVEAELFGSRKGAFTGATETREGLVRASDGGTLFLDEVGDLAPRAQPTLLRVLQEREVMAVGTTRVQPVDLRVVAATHRNLDQLVGERQFRADLLARLSGFVLQLPPLAARLDDIGILVASILQRHAADPSELPSMSAEAMRALLRYPWPLNIRELDHALSSATALSPSRIEAEHLPQALRGGAARQPLGALPATRARNLTPEQQAQRDELIARLTQECGNISEVARQMGKDRVQIRRWIRLYAIDLDELR